MQFIMCSETNHMQYLNSGYRGTSDQTRTQVRHNTKLPMQQATRVHHFGSSMCPWTNSRYTGTSQPHAPIPCALHGEKWSSEQSRISRAYMGCARDYVPNFAQMRGGKHSVHKYVFLVYISYVINWLSHRTSAASKQLIKCTETIDMCYVIMSDCCCKFNTTTAV